jgi:uncharacterized protein YfdQ (DUF2303 family)
VTLAADAPTNAGVTAALALTVAEHQTVDGESVATLVVPSGAGLRLIDPEALQSDPLRARGRVQPATVAALVAYCNAHNDQRTEVWVSQERIVAVLNGKGDDVAKTPGWGDHRAELTLKHTPEWLHWTKLDGQMVTQADFADHIEEGLDDIVDPESADMLEVAKHFHVSRGTTFRSSQHLESGAIGFTYDETDTTKAGQSGSFEIPKQFTIGIPVYEGEEAYRINARFRYRLADGVLLLGYRLERPDLVKRDAAEQIANRLRSEEGAFAHVYDGAPGEPIGPKELVRTA